MDLCWTDRPELMLPPNPRRWIKRLAGDAPNVLYFARTDAPMVALTIEDGPCPDATPHLLNILREHGAQATFFLITSQIKGREVLVERMVQEGHELGNHFTRNRPSIRLSPRAFRDDLLRADAALRYYAEPRWCRPGYGLYTPRMVRIAQAHGYRMALGDVHPFDFAIGHLPFLKRYTLAHTRPGSVIILHDGGVRGLRAAEVLAHLLPHLHRQGLQAVSLSTLMQHGRASA